MWNLHSAQQSRPINHLINIEGTCLKCLHEQHFHLNHFVTRHLYFFNPFFLHIKSNLDFTNLLFPMKTCHLLSLLLSSLQSLPSFQISHMEQELKKEIENREVETHQHFVWCSIKEVCP